MPLTVNFALLKVRFQFFTLSYRRFLILQLIRLKIELICRGNAVVIRAYSLNFETKLYWLANLRGGVGSIHQWVREGMAILGWLTCINCDFDLNLGLFGHLADENTLGNFQIGRDFVQDHACVIWPSLSTIVGKLDYLLKLLLGGSHCLVVGILEAHNFERDVLTRARLMLGNLNWVPTLFLAILLALDGLTRFISVTTDTTAFLIICIRNHPCTFWKSHSLLWFFIFVDWVHLIIHSHIIFASLLSFICLQVPLWLLPLSLWVDWVKVRKSLLPDVGSTRWFLLVDEKPYHEAGLIWGVESLFESFFQSLVICDNALLIGIFSLICQKEHIRVRRIAVARILLVGTGQAF